jgi:hypothetical protein
MPRLATTLRGTLTLAWDGGVGVGSKAIEVEDICLSVPELLKASIRGGIGGGMTNTHTR